MHGLLGGPGSSLMGVPMGSGIPSGGATPASRQNQKFDSRLSQVEQSNRALLEELMKIQNEIKVALRREQQKSDEQQKQQQKYDQLLKQLQSKVVETEERAKRAEQMNTEMRQTIQQLQLSFARQETSQPNSDNEKSFKKEMDHLNSSREYLEKSLKNELTELKGKVNSNEVKMTQLMERTNSDSRRNSVTISSTETEFKSLQKKVEHLQMQLTQEMKSRQNLEKNKPTEPKQKDESLTSLNNQLSTLSKEFHQVLAVEIQTRRDQFELLTFQIEECNSNVRSGIMTLQKNIGSNNEVNWKLDAVKVHQISQEKADEVRNLLEKELQKIRIEHSNMKNVIEPNTQQPINIKSTEDKVISPPNNKPLTNTKILGNQLEQQTDHLSFGHEKLKKQVNDIQLELDLLTGNQNTLNLEDKLATIDRKFTARLDGETRERTIEGKNIKNEIELLKKNGVVVNPVPIQKPDTENQEISKLREEFDKSKVNFRKMAESIQVVKTTLGEQISQETKIRTEETSRLEKDIKTVKNWIKSNTTEN
ncbi:hypothetical protein CHUAL_011538 [Chamberlinius hualienensis]